MKKSLLILVVLVIAVVAVLILRRGHAGFQKAVVPVIARIYFAGTDHIANNPYSTAFKDEFGGPEARAMESQTLDKLSHAPAVWFKDKLLSNTNDGSAQLRPLLDDFLKSEWLFEMRDAPATPEYALAIRLDDNRAQLWQDNLRSLLESWTKIKAQDIPGGWELKKDAPPNLFRMVRAGDWLVVGCGQDELPLSDAWSRGGIPQSETNWASADVDWQRLAQIFPAFGKFDFPRTELQVGAVEGNLKLEGKLDLSQPLPMLEGWQIPTNIIHQPLTSFTAVRGFAPWLESQPRAKLLALSPQPDQAFIWSLGMSPFQTFLAVPVPNATNALAQLGQNLTADTNWENHLITRFAMARTARTISWENVPFMQPQVQAVSGPSGDFLLAGVFPNMPRGKAPPPELLRALDRDNLVFYHWEFTSARLTALPELTQLVLLLTKHRQIDEDAAAVKWLNHITPSLGNCVTEVTQTGPAELAFVRTGPAGLTAVELTALITWLEAPNFPGCDMSLPPRHLPPRHPHKKLSVSLPPR